MAPNPAPPATPTESERVRSRVLTALHLGKLRPGDRVPSVRRTADLAGVNPKTVHRAYATLVEEGLLRARPGGGTYISTTADGNHELPDTGALDRAIRSLRVEAQRLGLAPEELARGLEMFFADGLTGLPVAVCECNLEQLGLIARDLVTSLKIEPRPVSLAHLRQDPEKSLRGLRHCVTTVCHLTEVRQLLEPLDVSVHAVALDSDFPACIARHAARDPGIMVVRDRRFGGIFLKLLRQLSVPEDDLGRIRFASLAEVDRLIRGTVRRTWLHVSPLVAAEARTFHPLLRVRRNWRVRRDALDRLRAGLSIDLARGHRAVCP